MSCRRTSLACALAFLATSTTADQLENIAAVVADDECGGDEVCAWNALQLRARRQALEESGPEMANTPKANLYKKSSSVGGYGGQCTCPDGQVYEVGDNNDNCGTLACEGGTPSACTSEWNSTRAGMKVTCQQPPEEANWYHKLDSGVGGYGGQCMCPDGQVYEVGDKNDDCGSLACEGGIPSACSKKYVDSRAGRKVTCKAPKEANWYQKIDGVGGYGGRCTCPDGQVYDVGDNGDDCGSLACEGGTSSECAREYNSTRAGMKVTCLQPPEEANWYHKDARVGGYGGQCTCPDGQVYEVGDNNDNCGSLACEGGIPSACTREWNATRVGRTVKCQPPPTDCYDVQPDEEGECMKTMMWAKQFGYYEHPDWFPTVSSMETAEWADWQLFAWDQTHPKCPRPCKAKWDVNWCDAPTAPELWEPKLPDEATNVRVLSYNLFWWNLYNIKGGKSADDLIKQKSAPEPYDVIGLQECEDPDKVFKPVGLEDTYEAFLGSKAICAAYRKDRWELLEHGEDEVAMDMRTEYYGHRNAQWLRLQHKTNGMTMLFINHHGPLSVNSGGTCGGKSTANNLLKVMAKRGKEGDLLVLAGDFNANAASETVQSLWKNLHHVYNSPSFGGVDNIFANVQKGAVASVADLGSGGSDHHAIEAVLRVGGPALKGAPEVNSEPGSAVQALQNAKGYEGCLMSPMKLYVYGKSAWAKTLDTGHGSREPRECCEECQLADGCTAWTWEEWNQDAKGPRCTLRKDEAEDVVRNTGAVSGLPHVSALQSAVATFSAA